jgi:predicted membrane channel-forming protein YqfA (hemolysin III family)
MYVLCQISNLSMVFPILAAYNNGWKSFAAAIFFCMVCSIAYHTDERNPILFYIDLTGVICLVSVCMYILLFHHMTYVNLASCVYCNIGLWFFLQCPDPDDVFETEQQHKQYEYLHSAWHCFVMFAIFGVSYSLINNDNGMSTISAKVITEEHKRKISIVFDHIKKNYI